MPKQAKGKPAKRKKGLHVKIRFPKAVWSTKKGKELEKHLNDLVPVLVKGLTERTGDEALANFNFCKARGTP